MLPPELAHKIDDLMRADLLYWRDLWFGQLLLATKIVVVGLILEGPELMYEVTSIVRKRGHWGRLALPEAHIPDWVKLVAFFGWILIVLGVAGEWITDALVSDADNNLQTFTSINLAEALKEAGDAKTSAKGAAAASSRAEKSAKLANDEGGRAKEKASAAAGVSVKALEASNKSDVSASHATALVAEAVTELQQERAKRKELELTLAPRVLPFLVYADKSTNVDSLKPLAGTEVILRYIRDAEAGRAAANIRFLVERAGMKVISACPTSKFAWDGITVETFLGADVNEVFLQFHSSDMGDVVSSFFLDNDWEASSRFEEGKNDLKPTQLRIVVGFKPSPYFEPPQIKEARRRIRELRRTQPLVLNKPIQTQFLPGLETPVNSCPPDTDR